MKLAYKLVLSFLLVTAIMGAFGFFMFTDVSNKLSAKQDEIRKVTDLSVAAENFHIQNFHTQLLLWEYAYRPSEESLNNFYANLVSWEKSFATFTELADKADLSSQEQMIVGNLLKGMRFLRAGWMNFVQQTSIVASETLQKPTLNEDGSVKYPLLDKMAEYGYAYTYPMFDMGTATDKNGMLSSNIRQMEQAFDKIGFNYSANEFVQLQIQKIDAKQAEMAVLKSNLSTQFIITFLIILVVAVGIALVLTRAIVNPINKLSKVADAVSQGKTDLSVPDVRSKDEIGALARSFGRMVASLKFMMTDKEG